MFNRLSYYTDVLKQDMVSMADAHWEQFNTLLKTLEPICGRLTGKKILDIGCGKFHPNTTILHSLGNDVIGIDKSGGLLESAKLLLYKVLGKDRSYANRMWKHLEINHNVCVLQMDAEKLEFPDNIFDLVISNATFEHISNVRKAVCELARVLKVGGISYISIHLFTSFSGGHQFDYRKVPWGHLRGYGQAPVYLNKLREQDYLNIFGEYLNVIGVKDAGYGEGKELLTLELKAELKDYSETELLKKDIIIIARKKCLI